MVQLIVPAENLAFVLAVLLVAAVVGGLAAGILSCKADASRGYGPLTDEEAAEDDGMWVVGGENAPPGLRAVGTVVLAAHRARDLEEERRIKLGARRPHGVLRAQLAAALQLPYAVLGLCLFYADLGTDLAVAFALLHVRLPLGLLVFGTLLLPYVPIGRRADTFAEVVFNRDPDRDPGRPRPWAARVLPCSDALMALAPLGPLVSRWLSCTISSTTWR